MLRKFFRWLFIAKGWKISGEIPAEIKKSIVIGAPHTSNWDFFIAMGALTFYPQKFRYFVKKEAFRFPLKWIFKLTGGIPVDRSRHNNLVEAVVELFDQSQELHLIVPAEGTRKKVTRWHTGFYYMALGAHLPIAIGFVDFKKKEAGFGPMFWPSGDIRKDFEAINAFYLMKTAKHPESFSPNVEFKIDEKN